jgi:hypothetical protein
VQLGRGMIDSLQLQLPDVEALSFPHTIAGSPGLSANPAEYSSNDSSVHQQLGDTLEDLNKARQMPGTSTQEAIMITVLDGAHAVLDGNNLAQKFVYAQASATLVGQKLDCVSSDNAEPEPHPYGRTSVPSSMSHSMKASSAGKLP